MDVTADCLHGRSRSARQVESNWRWLGLAACVVGACLDDYAASSKERAGPSIVRIATAMGLAGLGARDVFNVAVPAPASTEG